jgi:hypothetical protein
VRLVLLAERVRARSLYVAFVRPFGLSVNKKSTATAAGSFWHNWIKYVFRFEPIIFEGITLRRG